MARVYLQPGVLGLVCHERELWPNTIWTVSTQSLALYNALLWSSSCVDVNVLCLAQDVAMFGWGSRSTFVVLSVEMKGRWCGSRQMLLAITSPIHGTTCPVLVIVTTTIAVFTNTFHESHQ